MHPQACRSALLAMGQMHRYSDVSHPLTMKAIPHPTAQRGTSTAHQTAITANDIPGRRFLQPKELPNTASLLVSSYLWDDSPLTHTRSSVFYPLMTQPAPTPSCAYSAHWASENGHQAVKPREPPKTPPDRMPVCAWVPFVLTKRDSSAFHLLFYQSTNEAHTKVA